MGLGIQLECSSIRQPAKTTKSMGNATPAKKAPHAAKRRLKRSRLGEPPERRSCWSRYTTIVRPGKTKCQNSEGPPPGMTTRINTIKKHARASAVKSAKEQSAVGLPAKFSGQRLLSIDQEYRHDTKGREKEAEPRRHCSG